MIGGALTPEKMQLIYRLKHTQDGKDYLNNILLEMLADNHKDLLTAGKQYRDELIGFGMCLDVLIKMFDKCKDVIDTDKTQIEPSSF